MLDLPRGQLILYLVAGLAVIAFGVHEVATSRAGDQAPPARAEIALDRDREQRGGGRVTVHVAGAVRRPGVYRLRAGSRADLAVQRAGGATRGGDLSQVNLAQELEDGRQIVVPLRAPAASVSGPGGSAPAGPVNLNTATLEQLDGLDGVGPVTAQSILDYRAEQGGFGSVDELDQVPGIGAATLEALRDDVTA